MSTTQCIILFFKTESSSSYLRFKRQVAILILPRTENQRITQEQFSCAFSISQVKQINEFMVSNHLIESEINVSKTQ